MKNILMLLLLSISPPLLADVDVYLGFGNPYYRPPVVVNPYPYFQYIPQSYYTTPHYVERYEVYRDTRPHRRRRDWDRHHYDYHRHHHYHD
jgi:hypothetical protein